MPIISPKETHPRFYLNGPHLQTIVPSLFRKVELRNYTRERIELPDGDFIDVDWLKQKSKKLVIVVHGLEGDSQRSYVKGILQHMSGLGWDGLGFNFRGCSGESNRTAKFYSSAATEDLSYLIDKIIERKEYDQIVLVGFSLGGNVCLLYGGKNGKRIPDGVKAIVAVSAPIDLVGSVQEIERWYNRHYVIRFLKSLKAKVREKKSLLTEFDVEAMLNAENFTQFDEACTAPINGFESALDYWTRASSLPYLEQIQVPTLLLNAKNDTFLSPASYPEDIAKNSSSFHLLQPEWGGHVGFIQDLNWVSIWSERKIGFFLTQIAGL